MRLIVLLMALLFVVLVACVPATTLQAQPLNTSTPDACANVLCAPGMQCRSGECVCADGWKKCGEKCIGQKSCCDDGDCEAGKTCEAGVCSARPECGYNSGWSEQYKDCLCVDGTKFCERQGKCIPLSGCCESIDCDDDERCAPVTYSATVCVNSGTRKCRIVHEDGITLEYLFPQSRFVIGVADILEGGVVRLSVNDTELRVSGMNKSVLLGANASLYVEHLHAFGGGCREDEE